MQSESGGNLVGGDGEGRIRIEGTARQRAVISQPGERIQVQASLRVAVVQIIRGQQAVRLRAHVTDLEEHVALQLALDGEVVLLGVLRAEEHTSELQSAC